MKTIHKYPLALADVQTISMPRGAVVLSVQYQGPCPGIRLLEGICVWAKVDTDNPPEPRLVRIFGTGHPCDCDPLDYRGTVQSGGLVWHVFFPQA